eukprot:TRINITY_DN13250_c0_g1_i1.p1 TRINITY_DN13250_c0_g1~~TRINITY_DN13250_c0_g1_i1.p1  ORF type:complete len:282 (+),score=42.48 TRINITY_DN13250_c0_g1_i1:62-847(+)
MAIECGFAGMSSKQMQDNWEKVLKAMLCSATSKFLKLKSNYVISGRINCLVKQKNVLLTQNFKQQSYLKKQVYACASTTVETLEVKETSGSANEVPISVLDIRVGKVLEVAPHPDADSLYVETIDMGEEEPRTIVSGLVKYVPMDEMKDRLVIVLANLKPRNMRGIKSFGMLLCASDQAHENVDPLIPPADSTIGERIYFGEINDQNEPESPNKVQKKKMWEVLQPELKTNQSGEAQWKGQTMMTANGVVTSSKIMNGNIS